jgi:hypothetical protein
LLNEINENNIENFAIEQLWSLGWQYVTGVSIAPVQQKPIKHSFKQKDKKEKFTRLIEKWFLAQKLGEKAPFVQSEKQYYQQHQFYYNNIRLLGLVYRELDYSKA